MSLILRIRYLLPNGLQKKSIFAPLISLYPISSTGVTRQFSPPAMKEEEEEEEVEMDQRWLPADYDPVNFDPTEHRSPPTERVWRLVDEISKLTMVEVAELSSTMLKKMGVKEPPVVGVMKPGAAGMAAAVMKASAAGEEDMTGKDYI